MGIANAETFGDLERTWKRLYPNMNDKAKAELKTILSARAYEILATKPNGWRVPKMTRRGNQITVSMAGSTFRSGRWGNGAGYRYAWHYLIDEIAKVGKYRSRKKADSVSEWVASGYVWRAGMRLGKIN